MRQLGLVEFVTLDGVMQGFGGPDEDRDGGFEHGGWGAPYQDPAMFTAAAAAMQESTAYLFGRRTYDKMIEFWPHQPDSNPMAAKLNRATKYVATRTLTELTWANTSRLEGDLPDAVAALKADGDGDLVVLGSSALAQQLITLGLVDRYLLYLHPLLLGTGKRLYPSLPKPIPLRLASNEATATGVLVLTYEPA